MPARRPRIAGQPHVGRFVSYLRVSTERQGRLGLDAIATMPDGAPLMIEVLVTHRCEQAKLERLRERNVAAIEIDLSGYCGEHTEALLTDLVLRKAHRI